MGIIKINNQAIRESLEGVRRQYLVGNLKMPQSLDFIMSEDVEIGISSYKNYTEEQPHYHTHAVEYQYMLSGWTTYLNTDTNEEYEFKKGDFYAIQPNTPYAQKCKAGTEILFIKVPSINDKLSVDLNSNIASWFEKKLRTIRTDYNHEHDMPAANSIKPAAAVAILHDGYVLMLKRKDNSKWTLPGGTMELTESLVNCAVREVKEECGLNVVITDILGTYTDPDVRIAYSDGEVRREFTIVYVGKVDSTEVVIDDESSEYMWIKLNEALSLSMAESQKKRIADIIEYANSTKKVFQ